MTIKVKKYIAKVAQFVEHEDGSISKEVSEITITGKRISEASVWKQIPRDARLLEHGYVETAYEVDEEELEKFCKEHGNPVVE